MKEETENQQQKIEEKYAVINGAIHSCVVLRDFLVSADIGLSPITLDADKRLLTCYEKRKISKTQLFDTLVEAKHFKLSEEVRTMQGRLIDMEYFVKHRLNVVFYCCIGVLGCECFGLICFTIQSIFGK